MIAQANDVLLSETACSLAVDKNTKDKLVDYDIPSIRPGGPNYVCDDIRNLNLIKKVTGWFPSGSGHAFVPCEAYISLTRKLHTNQLN